MHKKLTSLVVNSTFLLASFAVLAASPDTARTTVYGSTQVEGTYFKPRANNSLNNTKTDGISLTDALRGRIGVVATEELDDGLKGIAKAEFQIDTADGFTDEACRTSDCSGKTGVVFTPREIMVGLKGTLGQIELGRLKSSYKYTGGVTYDPFTNSLLEARGNGAMTGGELDGYRSTIWGLTTGLDEYGHFDFLSNHFAYRSPTWHGLSLSGSYGPEQNDDSYAIAIKLQRAMYELFLARVDAGDMLKNQDNPSAGIQNEYYANKFGGQLRLKGGKHKLSFQIEKATEKVIDSANSIDVAPEITAMFAGYQGTWGRVTLVLQGGTEEYTDESLDLAGNQPEKIKYYAAGGIYKFTKTFFTFAGYRQTNKSAINGNGTAWLENGGERVASLGLRKDFM
jgi:predicted porin